MQKIWTWLEGKKTKIGAVLLCAAAVLGVAYGQVSAMDGLTLFSAGALAFGWADKANRHQQQILQALTAVSTARTEGVAGALKSLEPLAVSDLVAGVSAIAPAPPVAHTVTINVNSAAAKAVILVVLLLGLAAPALHAQRGDGQPAPRVSYCAAQLPFGAPRPHQLLICRKGYALDYDSAAKIPIWDAHLLTPKHSFGCVARSNAFAADASLPDGAAARPADYLHSGYDMGHMSPDADFSFDAELERESFYLDNMAPQLPGLNRQTWKYLEEDIRAWAWTGKTLWIITGPVYSARAKTIGANSVAVPSAFWKVVADVDSGRYLAFEMPQKEGLGHDVEKFLVPLANVEGDAGFRIPLPKGAREDGLWNVDLKGYNAAAKAACG